MSGAVAAIIGLPITVPAAAVDAIPAQKLVQVDLHSFEPATPSPGEPVTIAGTITNVTDQLLSNVQALVRYDRRPLAARTDIAKLASEPELYRGWRPGHIYDIVAADLDAGETAPFELTFTFDPTCADPELRLPCLDLPDAGVYAIGVDANVTDIADTRRTGGTARTVVPWQGTIEESGQARPPGPGRPVDVALIWPLVAGPRIDSSDAGDDGVGDDASPPADTRLTELLAAPGDAPVTWALEPQVWSDDVAATIGDEGVLVLPPAVPDVGALARVDAGLAYSVAAQAFGAQREFSGGPAGRIDVAWPGAGSVSQAGLRAWTRAGYETVVVPRDAVVMASEAVVASIDTGAGVTTAILTDPGLDAALAANTGDGGPGQALDIRQRFLAETLLATTEPFSSGSSALVAAPPAGWHPSPEVVESLLAVWTGTPWIRPVRLENITGVARPPLRATSLPTAVMSPLAADTSGLPADYVRTLARLHDELLRYDMLLAEPDESSAELDDTRPDPALITGQAASALWQDDLDTASTRVAELRTSVSEALAGVSVVVNPSNTLSGNSGVFPVNIANNLTQAVTVRLDFSPANQDRLAIESVEARVPGGQQQTVQVRAEAVANGEVPVSVQLTTVDGVPLGGAQHTIVNATHYGTIGWFIVIGSALLFAGGLSWRMVRGRRRNEP